MMKQIGGMGYYRDMPLAPLSNHSVEAVLRAIPEVEIRAKQAALAKLARKVTLRNDDAVFSNNSGDDDDNDDDDGGDGGNADALELLLRKVARDADTNDAVLAARSTTTTTETARPTVTRCKEGAIAHACCG